MYVVHRYELPAPIQERLRNMTPKFGYNGFGEILFYRTYSRMKKDGRQESWADVVIRVTNGTMSIRKDFYIKNHIAWDEESWTEYAESMALAMFKMEWLPPGRGLWAMGSDFVYERGAMGLYNCSYSTIREGKDLIDDVAWLMDSLMHGVGVGFGPRPAQMKRYNPRGRYDFIIPDTREGWVESVKAVLSAYLVPDQRLPNFIYDRIRPAGMPIKGFGGIASGPEPLKVLHEQLIAQMDDHKDSVILKTNIANLVGTCVVAGNVRRSAEIACGSIRNSVFLDLKNYKIHPDREAFGWMSNNSCILESEEDFDLLGEVSKRVLVNGEPGAINKKNLPYGRIGKPMKGLRYDAAEGFNPCQPGWALVLTQSGLRTFDHIKIGDLIWSETGWTKVIDKACTGTKKVYKYTTRGGIFFGTEDHRVVSESFKIKVDEALTIDTLTGPDKVSSPHEPYHVMSGLLIGDGTRHQETILLDIGEKDQDYFTSEIGFLIRESYSKGYSFKVYNQYITIEDLIRTFDRIVPFFYFYAPRNIIASFLRGLYSANGSVVRGRVSLKASSKKLIEQVQTMLSVLGIRSYYTVNKSHLCNIKGKDYTIKESYDLQISCDREKFQKNIGFLQKYKEEKLAKYIENVCFKGNEKISYEIIEKEFIEECKVYDITVDNYTHTYWTQGCNVSNCGEIPLEHREVCNLTETFPTVCQSIDDWYKACEYSAFYSSTVSLLPTHQPETNKVVGRNRRIGVGIVDFTGWKHLHGVHKVTRWLRNGYNIVRETNRWVNGEAGVPEAIRVTTVKPGGTVPKLPGRTSGVGHPTFHYTLRRVRVQANSPIDRCLKEANIPHEKDFYSANTNVFEFPILQGPSKPAEMVSIWEQANNLVLLQREWADNAVSNTLYFKPKWRLITHLFSSEPATRDIIENYFGFIRTKLLLENYDEEFVLDDQYKMTIQYNDDGYEVKIYEYDPLHEENDVEAVLSSIVPLIKSVSLLPHTAKGVYKQMPEEGITKEEYEERLSQIKPIDWSKFSGSDGMDERYCTGDTCEVTR